MSRMLSQLAQTAPAPTEGLTVAGAVVMILSIGMVLSLMIFCLKRILSEPSPGTHHHAPLDIDTGDDD